MLPEPIPAAFYYTGEPVLVLGAMGVHDGDPIILGVVSDGELITTREKIRTDWRYNEETNEWFDINAPQVDQEHADPGPLGVETP